MEIIQLLLRHTKKKETKHRQEFTATVSEGFEGPSGHT